ncbi:MAG TPA: glycosyltransferase [Thermomicrobiaceae bacterium]|nr:glycosyltransferase [Thermomicrobiaceae bacterium]
MAFGPSQCGDPAAERVDVSLIIPAYNEARRLPATLHEVVAFLSAQPFSWELIIADDGSEDATVSLAAQAATQPGVRHLRLPHRGKAAAVRAGVRAARGRSIIFTDADLSTPVAYVADAHRLLDDGWEMVIGTREAPSARRIGEPYYRHLMGRVFNWAVRVLAVPGLRDTQCGFKGFRAGVACDLFRRARLYRDGQPVRGPLVTGFDVELLYLARRCGYRLYELPVTWSHVAGSKVRPGLDSLLMLRDVLAVRRNALRGAYRESSPCDPAAAESGHV